MTIVVALGGNALTRPGERGTAAEQLANLRVAAAALAPVLGGGEVVITHGNGPQVGAALLRQDRAADEVPPLPLYLAVAETQAEIGALIAAEVRAATQRDVAVLVTHVLVAEDDPAFAEPTKPIGPFYDEARARELERTRGWAVSEDAGRGWRRLVASPQPLEVVEAASIAALVRTGAVTVACGGGGIPVVERGGTLKGVDAVIDKDRASALLAERLGAKRLLILTEVPAVYRGFRTSEEHEIRELRVADVGELLPELPPGSMRPKVEACAAFVTATGGDALITSADALEAALAGEAGTRISR